MDKETEFSAEVLEMIGRRLGAQQSAFQLAIYAVIAALGERNAIDPARVIAWTQHFAEQLTENKAHAEYEQIAANLQTFAHGLQSACTMPEGAGRA